MEKIHIGLLTCLLSLSILIPIHAFGNERDHASDGKDNHAMMTGSSNASMKGNSKLNLQEQVELLTKRLERLEKLVPTFAGFMPEISERFHVLHRAGDAEDWGLANHEIQELKRLVGIAKIINPEKGQLMDVFMSEKLEALEKAAEHGSQKAFKKTVIETVSNCNACHKATGSPFIQVGLDIPDTLSLRHSHLLAKSKVSVMKHTH